MWRLLSILIALSGFYSCTTICRNNTSAWAQSDSYSGKSSKELQLNHVNAENKASQPQDSIFDPNNIQSPTWYNDTFFLKRSIIHRIVTSDPENVYISTNFIYIDTNRSNGEYDWMTNYDFYEYYDDWFTSIGFPGIRNVDDLPGKALKSLPKNLLPLYPFRDELYLYRPSDSGFHDRRIITDSIYMRWSMDAPEPCRISNIESIDENSFSISSTCEKLIIHVIDFDNKLFILEDPAAPINKRFRIYTSIENAKEYDMIVNTGNEKAIEYRFNITEFVLALPTMEQ